MAAAKSSHRLSIPETDVKCREWIANQVNLSLAVRILIQRHVAEFGSGDILNVLPDAFAGFEGPIRRGPGRPPGSRNKSGRTTEGIAHDLQQTVEKPDEEKKETHIHMHEPVNTAPIEAAPTVCPETVRPQASEEFRPDPLRDKALLNRSKAEAQGFDSEGKAQPDTREVLTEMLGL